MRRIENLWRTGLVVIALSGTMAVGLAPAGAAQATGSCPAACVAGRYVIHIRWAPDQHWHRYPLHVDADHTATIGRPESALHLTWTKHNDTFTMSFAAFGGTGSYVGARNDNGGFSHRSRPGTMSNSDGNTGTWWAVADPSAGGDA